MGENGECEEDLFETVRVRKVGDDDLAWVRFHPRHHALGSGQNVFVTEFDALGITSSSTSVTKDVDVILGGQSESRCFIVAIGAHFGKIVNSDAKTLCLALHLSIKCFACHEYQVSNVGSHALLLHLDNLNGIVGGADNACHLCLVEDVLDLLRSHGIVEAHGRDIVVHACKQ